MPDVRDRNTSWIDAVVAGVRRLPGPSWLAYLIGTLAAVIAGSTLAWADGTVTTGTADFLRVYTDALVFYQLAVIHYLLWSARTALDAFAPALGDLAPERENVERRLPRVPVWISFVAIVLGLAYAGSFLLGDPAGVGLTPQSSLGLWIFVAATTVINGVFFAALVLVVVRMMAIIVRIHAGATAISIFDPVSHSAFARLTLRASVGLALPVYVFTLYQVLTGKADEGITIPVLVTVVSLVGGAVGVFFIPLAGIHQRLVRQKSGLIAAVLSRLGSTTREVHAKADSGDLTKIGDLEALTNVLVAERDAVRKLSTWPWEAETLRAFLSSIGLPILVWFVTTLLGRLLGS